jgi:hypothetical protein
MEEEEDHWEVQASFNRTILQIKCPISSVCINKYLCVHMCVYVNIRM